MNIHYLEILYDFLGENLKKYLNVVDEKKIELLVKLSSLKEIWDMLSGDKIKIFICDKLVYDNYGETFVYVLSQIRIKNGSDMNIIIKLIKEFLTYKGKEKYLNIFKGKDLYKYGINEETIIKLAQKELSQVNNNFETITVEDFFNLNRTLKELIVIMRKNNSSKLGKEITFDMDTKLPVSWIENYTPFLYKVSVKEINDIIFNLNKFNLNEKVEKELFEVYSMINKDNSVDKELIEVYNKFNLYNFLKESGLTIIHKDEKEVKFSKKLTQ